MKTGGTEIAWGAAALLLGLICLALNGNYNAALLLENDNLTWPLVSVIIANVGGKRVWDAWKNKG